MNKSTFIPGILAAMLVGSVATPAMAGDPQTAMNKASCTTCHSVDKKMVGPAFKDVAAKYKVQDVNQQLYDKVPSVILASATLSVGGEEGFHHFQNRLGLDDSETRLLGSPFDFQTQADCTCTGTGPTRRR